VSVGSIPAILGTLGKIFYAKLLLLDKIRHLPVLWGRTRLQREPQGPRSAVDMKQGNATALKIYSVVGMESQAKDIACTIATGTQRLTHGRQKRQQALSHFWEPKKDSTITWR